MADPVKRKVRPVRAKLTRVIAERDYRLVTAGGRRRMVVLRLGAPRPFPDGQDHYCVYQVLGLEEGDRTRLVGGADGIQALHLTLQLAAVDLATTRAYREGRLTWEGSSDLGLPAPAGLAPSRRSRKK